MLNKLLLNQEALRLLKRAGIEVNFSLVHCFQLLRWGFRHEIFNVDAEMIRKVEALPFWEDQVKALVYLITDGNGRVIIGPLQLRKATSPEAGAQLLVSLLLDKLVANVDYQQEFKSGNVVGEVEYDGSEETGWGILEQALEEMRKRARNSIAKDNKKE